MKYWSLCVIAALSLGVPGFARADAGFVTANVNLRAGPDIGYPLIDQIRAGTDVDVQGCTSGWEWCDVIVYDERGWVAGNYIQYDYDDRDVLLPQYGAQIGIPIISFSIGTYWNRYYRNRPFYSQRSRWYRYRSHHRAPPPVRHPYRGPRHVNRSGGHADRTHGYSDRNGRNDRPSHLRAVNNAHPVRRSERYSRPEHTAQPTRERHARNDHPRDSHDRYVEPSRHGNTVHRAPASKPHAPANRPSNRGHSAPRGKSEGHPAPDKKNRHEDHGHHRD